MTLRGDPLSMPENTKASPITMFSGTALIVEEEFLVALEIQQVLQQAGIGEVLSFRVTAEAEPRFEQLATCSIAVVEAHLGAAPVIEFVTRLAMAGVPVVVTSADRSLSSLFPLATCLDKPFDAASLLAACARARALVS